VTASVETMAAKQEILETLYRYCHAVDRMDPAIWKQVWHDDAVAHYEGIFEGSAEALMEWIFQSHAACNGTSHQVTNAVVEVDGDRATSTSYVTACVRAGSHDVVVRGRYTDHLSLRQGRWRIDERHYDTDLMQTIPVAGLPA
jgi:hypothetical protein